MTEEKSHAQFLIIPYYVADHPEIDDPTALLYGRLNSMGNNKHGYSWASDNHLAKECNCSVNTISTRLKRLKNLDLIRVITKRKGMGWDRRIYTSNHYQMMESNKDIEPQNRAKKSLRTPNSRGCDSSPVGEELDNYELDKVTSSVSSVSKDTTDTTEVTSEVAKAPLSKGKKPLDVPPQAIELSEYLFDKIKGTFPTTLPPKFDTWAVSLDRMNRLDHRSWDDIRSMIDWVFDESDFWCKNILSADTLRKQYDKMMAQRTPVENQGTQEARNRKTAQMLRSHFIASQEKNRFQVNQDFCFLGERGDSLSYNMNPNEFEAILTKTYGIEIPNASSHALSLKKIEEEEAMREAEKARKLDLEAQQRERDRKQYIWIKENIPKDLLDTPLLDHMYYENSYRFRLKSGIVFVADTHHEELLKCIKQLREEANG